MDREHQIEARWIHVEPTGVSTHGQQVISLILASFKLMLGCLKLMVAPFPDEENSLASKRRPLPSEAISLTRKKVRLQRKPLALATTAHQMLAARHYNKLRQRIVDKVDHTTGGKPFVLPGEIINKNNLSGTHPRPAGDSA
jgi:hypothetical protein